MDEETAKAAEKANRIYMGHLRKIEEYLSPVFLNHLSDATKAIVNVDKIEQSCLYLRKNFNDVVVIKMETERRAMFLMTTSKIFFRVYSVDTFDTISGQKEFQSLVDLFGAQIIQIYSREIQNIKKYATDMLKVLFTNLIADNLIEKCLDRFLSNKPKSQTGSFMLGY